MWHHANTQRFKTKASSALVPGLLTVQVTVMKLHGSDNRDGITVKRIQRAFVHIKKKCAIYFLFFIYLITYEAGSHTYLSPSYICILTFSPFLFCSVWARMLQLLVQFFLRDLKSSDVRNVSFFSQHFTNTMYLPHFLYKPCQLYVITIVNTLCMYWGTCYIMLLV